MSIDNQLVQYFDEWEQSLPPDARAALRPLFDQARAAEATPSDGAIYEAVSRRADPAAHDAAVAESLAVLGPGNVVTVTEKGPWHVSDWGEGRLAIQSDDFTHDVALEVSGDFGSPELKRAHAEEITRRLNGHPVTRAAVTGDLLAAADAVVERWHSRDWKQPPTASFIERLARAVGWAKRVRDLYTCVGKGGVYEDLAFARGAGTHRGVNIIVYRDVKDGGVYWREVGDFNKRMEMIDGAHGGKDES
jgi:hypothetical protein